MRAPPEGAADAVVHLVAGLTDVAPAYLRDSGMLGGLLIAAAGAAGLHATSAPLLRLHSIRGVDGLLMLDGGHAAVHAHAARRMLLVDIIAAEPANLGKALEVFTRRLMPGGVTMERLLRLSADS